MRGTLPDGEESDYKVSPAHNLENEKEEIKIPLSSKNITIKEVTWVFIGIYINADAASFIFWQKKALRDFNSCFISFFMLSNPACICRKDMNISC